MIVASSVSLASPYASAAGTSTAPVPSQTSPAVAPVGNGTGVQSLANTILRYYELAGYGGNFTIYPTTDANPTFLQPIEAADSSDTRLLLNDIENAVSLNTDGTTAQFSNYQYSTGNSWLQVDIWVGSLGVSANATEAISTWNFGTTTDQDLSEILTHVPPGTHTDIQTSWDSGGNATSGNDGKNVYGVTDPLGDAALTTGEQLIPPLGWLDTGWSVMLDLIQASGAYQEPDLSDTLGANNAGTQSVNQYAQISGGTAPAPANNLFNQDTLIQTTMSYPNATSTGGIWQIAATNVLSLCTPGLPCGVVPPVQPADGAQASVFYQVDPAIGVGGTVYVWPGGPVMSGIPVTLQEQSASNENVFTNLQELSGTGYYPNTGGWPAGYWHTFGYPFPHYAQYWAQWPSPLSTVNLASTRLTTGVNTGSDSESANINFDGGQVQGTVFSSAGGYPVPDAWVTLCNAKGCTGAQANQNGYFEIDFPVDITEGSFYISAPGYTTQHLGPGYVLTVGQYNTEGLDF